MTRTFIRLSASSTSRFDLVYRVSIWVRAYILLTLIWSPHCSPDSALTGGLWLNSTSHPNIVSNLKYHPVHPTRKRKKSCVRTCFMRKSGIRWQYIVHPLRPSFSITSCSDKFVVRWRARQGKVGVLVNLPEHKC